MAHIWYYNTEVGTMNRINIQVDFAPLLQFASSFSHHLSENCPKTESSDKNICILLLDEDFKCFFGIIQPFEPFLL